MLCVYYRSAGNDPCIGNPVSYRLYILSGIYYIKYKFSVLKTILENLKMDKNNCPF